MNKPDRSCHLCGKLCYGKVCRDCFRKGKSHSYSRAVITKRQKEKRRRRMDDEKYRIYVDDE